MASHGKCSLVISQSSSLCSVKGSKPNPSAIPRRVSDLCCIFSPRPFPYTCVRPFLILHFRFHHHLLCLAMVSFWCHGEIINHIEGKRIVKRVKNIISWQRIEQNFKEEEL
ncbi:hypothetical protein GLYMA_13G122766v4 [Glycine max]|nr:hypothetical protein GLYMA_13G122766v4 [Glycine max]KAH1101131.1 hypothetical protein GYH30_035960 [Glycine max]